MRDQLLHGVKPQPSREEVRRGYAHETTSIKAVVLFGVGLLVAIAVVLGAMTLLFSYFGAQPHDAEPPNPMRRLARAAPPVGPQLQVAEIQDMKQLRQTQLDQLENYGWVDRENGIVHVPIDKAKAMIVQQRAAKNAKQEEQGNTR
ncbi:MAG: hypothetical protein WD042_14405 [Phycisphaeraceae bacterium]